MTKLILLGGAVFIVALGAVLVFQPAPQETAPESAEEVPGQELPEDAGASGAAEHVVIYSDSGYSPEEIAIRQGDTVTFRNESSRTMWPATAIHPTHREYPGSGIEKCAFPEKTDVFDACGEVEPGGEWAFVFREPGTWRYHDHRRPQETGAIIVEE